MPSPSTKNTFMVKGEDDFNFNYESLKRKKIEEAQTGSNSLSHINVKREHEEIVQSFDTPKCQNVNIFHSEEGRSTEADNFQTSESEHHNTEKQTIEQPKNHIKGYHKASQRNKKIRKIQKPTLQNGGTSLKKEKMELMVEEPALFKYTREFPDWPLHTIFEFLEESADAQQKRSQRSSRAKTVLQKKIDYCEDSNEKEIVEEDEESDCEDDCVDDYQPSNPKKRNRKRKVPYTGKRRGRPRKNQTFESSE